MGRTVNPGSHWHVRRRNGPWFAAKRIGVTADHPQDLQKRMDDLRVPESMRSSVAIEARKDIIVAGHHPTKSPAPTQVLFQGSKVDLPGMDDPRISVALETLNVVEPAPFDGTKLDLEKIGPGHIEQLSPTALRHLMSQLKETTVKVETMGLGDIPNLKRGILRRKPASIEMSGAAALILKMWSTQNTHAFARTYAAAPAEGHLYLTSRATNVLASDALMGIITEMKKSAAPGSEMSEFEDEEIWNLGDLVAKHIADEVDGDLEKTPMVLQRLFLEALRQDITPTPETIGTVVGLIAAGATKFEQNEQVAYEKDRATWSSRTNMAWAASWIPGMIFGGWIGAVVTGLFATGVVGVNVHTQRKKDEEFMEEISHGTGAAFKSSIFRQWTTRAPEIWGDTIEEREHAVTKARSIAADIIGANGIHAS